MKKGIILIITILLLCGCSKEKECIEEHEEKSICSYPICPPMRSCYFVAKPCTKIVCDKYEE